MSEVHTSNTIVSRDSAKFSGKYCVLANPGDHAPIVSPLYETREEACAAKRALAGEYPGAVTGYWPTQDEHEEWQRHSEWVHSWDVECWQVMETRRFEDGATTHEPVTPPYASREQAEAAFAEIRPTRPNAYLAGFKAMFHPEKPEDMERREALVSSMVGDPA